MKNILSMTLFLFLNLILAGCACCGNQQNRVIGAYIPIPAGNAYGPSMNYSDKLYADAAIGVSLSKNKPVSWVSHITSVEYTVIPLTEINFHGNPNCRNYRIISNNVSFTRSRYGIACYQCDNHWITVK